MKTPVALPFPLLLPGTDFPVPFPEGLILTADKPLGWSSFDVVNKLRYLITRRLGLRRLKIGHAGTLDPLATGLLVLCVGKATSLIEQLQADEKEYTGVLTFGATTPSHDRERPIEATYPTEHLTNARVQAAAQRFVGDIEQTPPVFSAIKVDGRRLYKNARRGDEPSPKARRVRVDVFEVGPLRPVAPEAAQAEPAFLNQKGAPIRLFPDYAQGLQCDFRVVCGKGTYIRSLVADLGAAVGSGAYLSSLRRTRSGIFSVETAWTIAQLEAWAKETNE
ncbi:MAG: tRNA pseudouridine(55) synthase TruB [Saprospiraceae bacterium]|nr:tRNA pseudouridine(55) synthase TruB [Saprospiraceae bacterium]MDW8230621.1 tRNA pseudouridine(55) synthase TruB [Saprospiraceae bacterium]